MSLRVMTLCWSHSRARGTDLLVLLALADVADDGGECWPSVPHVAAKCRLDPRTTQRRIRSLERLGEVVVVVAGGKASSAGGRKSNRYRIVVSAPGDPGKLPPPANCHPGTGATRTLAPVPPRTLAPVPPRTLAPVPPDPSVDPSVDPSLTRHSLAPASPPPAARPRDELFDAVAEVCGIHPAELTASARGAMNRALRDLRDVGADPAEIGRRATVYRRQWPHASLTPTALARRWAEIAGSAPLDVLDEICDMARRAGR